MLFKTHFLDLIKQNKLGIAFRKWTKPTVKAGGSLTTAVGVLRIEALEIIDYKKITDKDIVAAGYKDRKELDKEFSLKPDGNIYLIRFVREGDDPRLQLRENDDLSSEEIEALLVKLKKMDSGQVKNWTYRVLAAIAKQPGQRAIDYASKLDYEKSWFKPNVRKLKNLGLTISLVDGYDISPRGEKLLATVKKW